MIDETLSRETVKDVGPGVAVEAGDLHAIEPFKLYVALTCVISHENTTVAARHMISEHTRYDDICVIAMHGDERSGPIITHYITCNILERIPSFEKRSLTTYGLK